MYGADFVVVSVGGDRQPAGGEGGTAARFWHGSVKYFSCGPRVARGCELDFQASSFPRPFLLAQHHQLVLAKTLEADCYNAASESGRRLCEFLPRLLPRRRLVLAGQLSLIGRKEVLQRRCHRCRSGIDRWSGRRSGGRSHWWRGWGTHWSCRGSSGSEPWGTPLGGHRRIGQGQTSERCCDSGEPWRGRPCGAGRKSRSLGKFANWIGPNRRAPIAV